MSAPAVDLSSTELLDAALGYAAKNLPVFPCNQQNKRPLVPNGLNDASTDQDTVRGWWERWPDAMIGMPTGARTGFWALDVDDPEAFEACAIKSPATRRCNTGKGYHLLFKYDPAREIRNSQRHPKTGWPFPGLPGCEVRGEGGYVIVPPSLHPNGRRYQWHDGSLVVAAPPALLAIVRKQQPQGQKSRAPANDQAFCRIVSAGRIDLTAWLLSKRNARQS